MAPARLRPAPAASAAPPHSIPIRAVPRAALDVLMARLMARLVASGAVERPLIDTGHMSNSVDHRVDSGDE